MPMPSHPEDRIALNIAAIFVRQARLAAGKTQRELAREINTSQSCIDGLENMRGKRGASLSLLMRIARACGRELKLTME